MKNTINDLKKTIVFSYNNLILAQNDQFQTTAIIENLTSELIGLNNKLKEYKYKPLDGIIDEYPTINITLNNIVSENILIHLNFEKKKSVSWFGNGQDYQIPPKKGGSKTEQQDYVIKIVNSERSFIVRIEKFSYLVKGELVTDESITYHYCNWYPKCYEIVPCYDYSKINNLLLSYKLITGKSLYPLKFNDINIT